MLLCAHDLERFVGAAVESVVGQLDGRTELVVVDDGSTDATPQRCAEVLARHPGVDARLVVQRNGGISAARNRAVGEARGRYLLFLDGDDVLLDGALTTLLGAVGPGTVDVVEFNATTTKETGSPVGEIRLVESGRAEAALTEADRADLADRFLNYVWLRVYRSDLLRRAPFPEGRHYEDVAVVPRVYALATRVSRLDDALVAYRYRRGSIMRRPTPAHARDWSTNLREALARRDGSASDATWSLVACRCLLGLCATAAHLDRERSRAARALAVLDLALLRAELGDTTDERVAALLAECGSTVARIGYHRLRGQGRRATRTAGRRLLRR